MNILYLYVELTPSVIAVMKYLASNYNASIHVLYWEKGGNTPYKPPIIDNVFFYPSKTWTSDKIFKLVSSLSVNLCYVTAWQDKRYLVTARSLAAKGIPVIAGFDDVWDGTLRQYIGSTLVSLIGHNFFSHAMVSGPRQYEYARRFGFKHEQILYYLFSGDTDRFENLSKITSLSSSISHRKFIFVGQLITRKGVDTLCSAYQIYRKKYKGLWKLACLGDGPLRNFLEEQDDIEIYGYVNHEEMTRFIAEAGAFILPSIRDVSPLVVHEFASVGLPLVLSKSIGNRHLFLIDGFNGFSFESGVPENLANAMSRVSSLSEEQLKNMGENSKALASQHQARFVAASLMSVIASNRSGVYEELRVPDPR
jgi:glycosyltransferase involved in cell wall biosynthesis